MKAALLYSSSHGKTRKVVSEVLPRLKLQPDVFDVKDRPAQTQLAGYDLFLVFTPTYGDEELQDDMEDFIDGFNLDLRGRQFVICELGNYYGYDTYSFGALPILRQWLTKLNAREFFCPLSLDSFPKVHWQHLYDWVEQLNARLAQHG